MSERNTPSTPSTGSPASPTGGHEIRISQVSPQAEGAATIDAFLARYPAALQTRATLPCPSCKGEIPVPHGSLKAHIDYLKATDPAINGGASVRLSIRLGCRIKSPSA